jgi:hypothetical protein
MTPEDLLKDLNALYRFNRLLWQAVIGVLEHRGITDRRAFANAFDEWAEKQDEATAALLRDMAVGLRDEPPRWTPEIIEGGQPE